MFSKIHAFDVSPMISRTRLLLLISAGIVLLESGNGGQVERITTRKPTIDELPLQHILLRSIMRHDGCRLYYPWSNLKNPSFEINNATCYHGCKIVGDLYEERYPDRPRLIRSGGCVKGIKIVVLECKCQLTSGFIKWRSLTHCAHTYLDGIVDFTISDIRPTTTDTPEPEYDYFDDNLNTDKTNSLTTNILYQGGSTMILTEGPTTVSTTTGVTRSALTSKGLNETMADEAIETTTQLSSTQRQMRRKKKQNKPWRKKFG